MKTLLLLAFLISPALLAGDRNLPIHGGVAITQAVVDDGKITLVVRNTTEGHARFEWTNLRLRIKGEGELQAFLGVEWSNGETENLMLTPGQTRQFRMRAAPRSLVEAVLWKDSPTAIEFVRLTKRRSPVYVGDVHAKNAIERRKAAEEKRKKEAGK